MASEASDVPPNQPRIKKILERFFEKKNASPGSFDIHKFRELEPTRQEMIKGVVSLSSKNAREIMIPRVDVVAVSETISLKDLVKVVDTAGHSRIPVYSTTIDNIGGILYVKDLLKFVIFKPRRFELKKILHQPYFVPETMTLDALLLEFKRLKLHLACVVDEYGGFGGIVTLEDILEEIVGEIKDEFDEDELPEFSKIGPGAYEIDSRLTLSDFNGKLGMALPNEEFDTIGGFVFDLFGKVPKKNETVKYGGISFKIKDIKGTRINRIIATVSRRPRS